MCSSFCRISRFRLLALARRGIIIRSLFFLLIIITCRRRFYSFINSSLVTLFSFSSFIFSFLYSSIYIKIRHHLLYITSVCIFLTSHRLIAILKIIKSILKFFIINSSVHKIINSLIYIVSIIKIILYSIHIIFCPFLFHFIHSTSKFIICILILIRINRNLSFSIIFSLFFFKTLVYKFFDRINRLRSILFYITLKLIKKLIKSFKIISSFLSKSIFKFFTSFSKKSFRSINSSPIIPNFNSIINISTSTSISGFAYITIIIIFFKLSFLFK